MKVERYADENHLVDTLVKVIEDFKADHFKPPEGLCIGPYEYALLCQYCTHQDFAGIYGLVDVNTFRDVKVYMQELPGINLLINKLDAKRYV